MSGVDVVVLARCSASAGCTPQPLFSPTIGVAVRGSGVTGANGMVEFDNLKPGNYAVCMAACSSGRRRRPVLHPLTAAARSLKPDVIMPKGGAAT